MAETPAAGRTLDWEKVLTEGHRSLRVAHKVFKHIPSAPRCKLCHNPFGGVGGRVLRPFGYRPSRKNPNMCARCCETLPVGGAEVDIGVLFADVRGSTTLAERIGPSEYATLLNRFYKVATDVLVEQDAIIDKLIGDEVMALFIPGIAGPQYRSRACAAALDLVRAVGYGGDEEPWLPLGVAVHAGIAYVGNVGEAVVDFTALGDAVNVAARLQGHAAAGEVVMSDVAYQSARELVGDVETRTLELRGRAEPIVAHVARPAA